MQTFVQNKPAAVIHQVFQIQKHFPRSPICKDLGVQVSPNLHPNHHYFFWLTRSRFPPLHANGSTGSAKRYVDVCPHDPDRCRPASLGSLLTGWRLFAGGGAVARLRQLIIVVAVGGAGGAECAAEVPHEGRRRPLFLHVRGRRRMIRAACACGNLWCVSTTSSI